MFRTLARSLAVSCLLVAAPALAQSAAEGPDDIVVTDSAEDYEPGVVSRQAREIAAIGGTRNTALARFEDHLCPGILGLQAEFAAMMIDRIRSNARDLDINVQPDGCTPNFVIAFSPDSLETMRSMVEDNPGAFQFLDSGDKSDLLQPGPVHVFVDIKPRTRDGFPIGEVRDLVSPPQSTQWMAHSRIYLPTRRDIAGVTIVFDSDAVDGMSIGQLADYATMRGLANTRRPGELQVRSILSLFDATGPYPERLTIFDRAYLQTLYDWIPNLPAATKLGRVDKRLRQLVAAERETRAE